MPHHFLVLGATGPSGIAFAETALSAGHALTIYARSPEKLPQHIQNLALQSNPKTSSPPQVQIFRGDFTSSQNSLESLTKALCSGATHLISFAGPAIPAKGTAITNFYECVLYPLLRELKGGEKRSKIKRVMVLSTPSFRVVPGDKFSLKWMVGVQFVYWFFGDAWEEVNGIGRVTTSLSSSTTADDGRGKGNEGALEWTVFRVPGLTNAAAGPVRAGFIGGKGDGMLLSRKGMAVWVLQEVEERKWVGGCPAICDAGGWI